LYPRFHLPCRAIPGREDEALPPPAGGAGRVRPFARAQGRRAQTDPIDATVLSAYGRALQPPPTPPPTPAQERLAALARRRRQLLETLLAETHRAAHYTDPRCVRPSRQLVRRLEKPIQAAEAARLEVLAADPQLHAQAQRLDALPGVGPLPAATVLAELPELGRLSDGAAAALAGLAPYNRDRGARQGGRPIAGGRAPVRCALYLAALSAVRHDRLLRTFSRRLRAAGQKPKVALVAGMRKLVVLLNRLLKNPHFQLAN
jgi:transposase